MNGKTTFPPLVLVLAILTSTPLGAQDPAVEPPVLTLQEALELARQNAPSLEVAQGSVDRAKAQELEAFLARLPTLEARSTWTLSGPIRGTPCESESGTDIGALQDLAEDQSFQTMNSFRAVLPLYTFGKINLAEDLAAVGYEVAALQRRKAQLELTFNLQRAYLGQQLSVKLQELIDDGLGRLASIRRNLERRADEGDRSARTDLRRLTIREADLIGQVSDNRMLDHLSRRALVYYCHLEVPFAVTPLDESLPETDLAPLEELLELAWQHRPDLGLLDRQVRARELSASSAWRAMTPDLFFSLGASFNYNPLADDQDSPFAYDPYNSSGLGFLVGLDWRFDFRRIAQARRAEADVTIARARQREMAGGIELEIEQAYLEAQGTDQRLNAYLEAYRASRAWLRQRTIQFDSGLASYDDLREPLIDYFTTSAGYYQALFASQLARANLALKIGLERLLVGEGLIETDSSQQTDASLEPTDDR
ncbi:MAG: TolC family protein [Bradymonadales bacterium]|nr:TolC family protein [Bradymonadales bacterium]